MIQLLQRIHLPCKPATGKPCSPKTGRRALPCGRHSRSAGIPLLHNRAIALPSRGTIRAVQEKSLSSRKRVEELLRLMQRASTRHWPRTACWRLAWLSAGRASHRLWRAPGWHRRPFAKRNRSTRYRFWTTGVLLGVKTAIVSEPSTSLKQYCSSGYKCCAGFRGLAICVLGRENTTLLTVA